MSFNLRGYKDYVENIIGIVVIFAVIFIGFRYFDLDRVKSVVEQAGLLAPLILIMAKASTMVFAPISGSPLYPLAGAVFGFGPAVIYLVLGDFLGSVISFYISRFLGRSVVERFARGNMPVIDKILSFMETARGFFIARVCFIAMPEAVSYAAGLTRISFKRFIVISTLVGLIPTMFLAGAGSSLSLGEGGLSATMLIILGTLVTGLGGWIFFKMTEKRVDGGGDL